MNSNLFRRLRPVLPVLGLWFAMPAAAGVDDPFPEVRPATRAHAIELLRARTTPEMTCLTPATHSLGLPGERTPDVRRALWLLQSRVPLAREAAHTLSDGLVVRYTVEPHGFDSADPSDADGDGLPDVVEAVALGLEQARRLLIDELDLAAPPLFEIRLVELGHDLDGYIVPGASAPGRITALLDGTPRHGIDGARRAAIHQFTHAVLARSGPGIAPDWSEALAIWAVLRIEGTPDADTAALLERRLEQMGRGLLSSDLQLTAGNALWLAFLDEAYGPGAVWATIDELARPDISAATALDNALRRASSHDLAAAFREFQLWTLLAGERSDSRHFSFAEALPSPGYAGSHDGLPALSVQAEPALGALGAAQVRFVPDQERGGFQIGFEGSFGGSWEADLILFGDGGTVHRLPFGLDADGRGELSVPVEGLDEAVLLVRHLGSPEGGAERYTYSARSDLAFPFELSAADARQTPGGVLVTWETASEARLVGFNVLRYRDEDSPPVAVNPVWVPALGAARLTTTYHFMDATAEPGVSYRYRIQGITTEGLSGRSDPIRYRPSGLDR